MGDGILQFKEPTGIALDSSGNLFVAEAGNNRIQKFTNTGGFIRSWGGFGSGAGQFKYPTGVAVDSSANVYTVEGTHRIQKFKTNGVFTTMWGYYGGADGQFRNPVGVAVKSANVSIQEERVFVADTVNNRIQVFKPKIVVSP